MYANIAIYVNEKSAQCSYKWGLQQYNRIPEVL